MVRKWLVAVLAMGMVVSFTQWAAAQADDAKRAQNKLLSKRAAEADAYRKLAESVMGLQITSDTYVKDFVTESDVIQSEMDTFIRGVRLGEPKWYEDLSCEVPAEVTVAQVITELKELHTRHYQGDQIKGTDFEQMKQHIKKDVIKAVGMGAPRPELPPDLPEGVEEMVSQGLTLPEPAIPDLWIKMGPQARLMAQRAARLDAMRRLLERIRGIRITSNTLVKDFVAEWDVIETHAQDYLVGFSEVRTYYHHDEPIVEVTLSIPTEQVIQTIKEIHTRHYQGDRVTGTDIMNLKQQIKRKTFEATGMGVPKPEYIQIAAQTTKVSIPDWASDRITATGNGTDPAIDTPQGKLKAARAAELDAKRRLAEQVMGLHISSDTLVRDFVTENDQISSQVDTVLIGAMVERTEWGDGVARVTVSLPGMEVWSVVYQQMRVVTRR
ncbi:MAG: hypothetical protein V2A79_18690 [Planctomycetota bacterium]